MERKTISEDFALLHQLIELVDPLFSLLASIAIIATLFYIARQAWAISEQLTIQRQEQESLRKKATLEGMHENFNRMEFLKLKMDVYNALQKDYGSMLELEKMKTRYVLNTYEHYAMMAQKGLMDGEIISEFWGSTFVQDRERLRDFISQERALSGVDDMWGDYERLCDDIGDDGNIRKDISIN